MSAIRDSRSGGAGGPASGRPLRIGLALVGVLLVAANLRAGIAAVGPVLGEIRSDLGFGAPAASLLISLPLVGFGAISPLAPGLARRFGLERTLGGSVALLSLAIVVRSLPAPGLIWIGTILLGAAIAVLNVLLPALLKRDYPDRIGQLTGIYSAVQGGVAALAAGFAVPIAGGAASGWRLAIGVWAGLALVGLAVFLPRMRERRPDPGSAGRHAGSGRADAADDLLPAEPAAPAATAGVWSSPLAWQVTLFLGLQSTVYYTVITWWPSIEQAHGTLAATAGWHQLVYQVFGIFGSLLAAALIHRRQSQSGLAAAFVMPVPIAMLGQILAPGASLFWIILLGISGGGTIAVALSLFGLRTRSHDAAADLSGMAQSVGYLIAAAGPVAIASLHDVTGSWNLALAVLSLVGLAETGFGILAGRDRFLEAGQ